jgi:prepilin-type N-terminal cleavage/methylation domain-containing protein
MKSIFTKVKNNNGFTLTECLIALFIFAIMTLMLMQILMMSVMQKHSNIENVDHVNKQVDNITSDELLSDSLILRDETGDPLNMIVFRDNTNNEVGAIEGGFIGFFNDEQDGQSGRLFQVTEPVMTLPLLNFVMDNAENFNKCYCGICRGVTPGTCDGVEDLSPPLFFTTLRRVFPPDKPCHSSCPCLSSCPSSVRCFDCSHDPEAPCPPNLCDDCDHDPNRCTPCPECIHPFIIQQKANMITLRYEWEAELTYRNPKADDIILFILPTGTDINSVYVTADGGIVHVITCDADVCSCPGDDHLAAVRVMHLSSTPGHSVGSVKINISFDNDGTWDFIDDVMVLNSRVKDGADEIDRMNYSS